MSRNSVMVVHCVMNDTGLTAKHTAQTSTQTYTFDCKVTGLGGAGGNFLRS